MESSMEQAMDVVANNQWASDINALLADSESLLIEKADQGGEKMENLRTKATASLRLARRWMAQAQNPMLVRTSESARLTDLIWA
jgi:ElaB/YqjD/DUF883 family membrane-anchored ribosome-binding protein